jgi:SAM-dependent methyltransferase
VQLLEHLTLEYSPVAHRRTLTDSIHVDDTSLWDSPADAYAEQPQVDWFDDFFDRYLPQDLHGRRVLDLGCGHGWFAAALARRGADITAVDGSERLLEIARDRHPGPTYRHVDLSRDGIGGTYDVVVALMSLMDLADLDRVRPTVAPGGVLVATILHPAFWNQRTVDEDDGGGYRRVRGYLAHETWWVEGFGGHHHYHRPLGFYVDWLASLGLGVVELFEPPALVYDGWRRAIPTRLGIAARNLAGQTVS